MTATGSQGYPYASREVLDGAAPYSFSPYEGVAFLDGWRRSRGELLQLLLRLATNGGGSRVGRETNAEERRWREIFPEIGFSLQLKPTPPDGGSRRFLRRCLRQARRAWRQAAGREGAATARVLRSILAPCLEDHLRLSPDSEEEAWAVEVIDLLLRRFELRRRIFPRYDARWHKVHDDPDRTEPYVWLGLAAAWRGLGAHGEQLATRLRYANALLKVLDRLTLLVVEENRPVAVPEAFLGAVAVCAERSLVAPWLPEQATPAPSETAQEVVG